MRSTPACSNTSIARRAKARASGSRPACSASAPQQPCARGATTSQPSAASTRTVASLTCAKASRCTQPVRSPTASGAGPIAGVSSAVDAVSDFTVIGGASLASARSRAGSRFSSPVRSSSGPDPAGRRRSGASASRSRAGYGITAKSAERNSRSPSVAIVAALDLRARGLDERRVLHARGARGDARHAAEAGVEVADEGVGHRHPPVEAGLHQIDPAARRVHLLAPQRVGRTGRQTEPAVHALVDQRALGRMVRRRTPAAGWRAARHSGPRPAPSDARRIELALERACRAGSCCAAAPQTELPGLQLRRSARTTTTLPNTSERRSRVAPPSRCSRDVAVEADRPAPTPSAADRARSRASRQVVDRACVERAPHVRRTPRGPDDRAGRSHGPPAVRGPQLALGAPATTTRAM